jgi:hypothetical protein
MDAAGGFRSNREHEVSRRTQNEWPATRRILVSRQRAGKILLRRAASCWDQAALTGARRPTHCIGRPRLSWRGSVPKVLRRSHLQLNRGGCGRCFCFRSRNTAAQVRALARGGGTWKIHELYGGLNEPVQYPVVHATQKDWKQLFRPLERWQTRQPKSITARVALARAYINYAYDARGEEFANTVSDSGWKLFAERITKAKLILEKASALPVTCPEWYVAMLLVAQNQSWEQADARALFDEAETREPGYYYDARVFAAYLLPKWSGQPGDTEHFIEEVSDRLGGDQGDILYFQIATASYVVCGCDDSPKLSRERIVRGLKASEERYGVSMLNLNRVVYLAIHYGSPDVIVADKVMSRIGEQWDAETWERKEDFDSMKEWAAKSAPFQAKKLEMDASADANSKTPEGIRYHASVEKTYRQFLQECARTDSPGVKNWQGKFEVLVTIGAEGTIEDNKIYAMGPVAVCTYHKLLNLKEQHAKAFPPPQAPYLVKLDLDWADFAPVASR